MVLAEAAKIETARSEHLSKALSPTIENSLQVSIRRDPKALADAISPVMGPAIRRSIYQAINSMVQSLNQAIDQTFTRKGLQWRIEAWRSGRAFAEVVALHTLAFQVEQVFLIHADTGLLITHRSSLSGKSVDPEIISGMLTAIQDFVRDSFARSGGDSGGDLDTVQVGERVVWLERGRDAYLAAVVRGAAPLNLHDTFREVLDRIEVEYGGELQSFQGDLDGLANIEITLGECLLSEAKEEAEDQPRSPAIYLAWAVALILLILFAGVRFRDNARWERFSRDVDDRPGIVVSGEERRDGRRWLKGIRDPLADPIAPIALRNSIDTSRVGLSFERFRSTEPELVLRRLVASAATPLGVELSLDGKELNVSGRGPVSWLRELYQHVEQADAITSVNREGFATEERAALVAVAERLDTLSVFFPSGSARVDPASESVSLIQTVLREAHALISDTGIAIDVVVTGSADSFGAPQRNRQLAELRAARLVEALGPETLPRFRFQESWEVASAGGATNHRRRVHLRLVVPDQIN
jgi:outer membrane protein OmpA-like peptidoglycan-associated protein